MRTYGNTATEVVLDLDTGLPMPGVQILVWEDETAGAQVTTGLLALDGTTPLPGYVVTALDGSFGWKETGTADGRWYSTATAPTRRWYVPAHEALDAIRDRVDTTETRVSGLEDELPLKLDVTAANSTFGAGAKDAAALRLLSNVASADRQKSLAESRANYEDAASFAETWANQTAWTFTAGTAQVSGNKLFSMGSGGASGNYSLPFTGKVRARAVFNVVAGGTAAWTGFGFTKTTSGATPSSVANMAWIGARGDGYVVAYDQGAVQTPAAGLQLTTGTYYITAAWDGTRISLSITNASGSVQWRYQVPTTFGTPTGLMTWTGDDRTTAGSSIGAITARAGMVTHPTRTIDGVAPSMIYTKDAGGQNIFVSLPKNYDSRKPVPLILVAHGNGGDAFSSFFNIAAQTTFYTSALADGYALASSDMHGTYGTWGSPNSVNDLLNLYRHCRDNYAIGPVVLIGESAGGATMFNALAQRVLPEVAALVAWYPVANLDEEYNNHGFVTPIKTAYGVASLADIDQSKYSPVNQPGYAFRGVPMRIYASPSDITVPTALNSQIVVDKAAAYSPEATIVTTSGGHGDPSNFQWSDVKAFLAKYVAG